MRFRLVSGNPDTPIIDSYYNVDSDIYMPVYGAVNSSRLPTFHQLDLRVDKNWEWKHLKLAIYIDVQNVYNFAIPIRPSYDFWEDNIETTNSITILPSIGISAEF